MRRDLDRSSGYTLSNLNENTLMGRYSSSSSMMSSSSIPSSIILSSTSSVTRRPPRDSSIGALGRSNRESSLTRVGSLRIRDNSLPRMLEVALPSLTSSTSQTSSSNRYSVVMPLDNGLGAETARYARENAIKEIHDNFMKGYKDTNDKINNRNVDEQGERRTKSYARILGTTSAVTNISEDEVKKHCISEMFMETGRFSTKTLAAVSSLENCDSRKKKDYNWRKEMEEYESSGQMERDRRARNIANAVGRRDAVESPRKREMPSTDDEDIWAVRKAPRKPDPVEAPKPPKPAPVQKVETPAPRKVELAPAKKVETPVVQKVEQAPAKKAETPVVRKVEAKQNTEAPATEKKSWRDNHPEKASTASQQRQQNRAERQQLMEALQQQKLEEQQRLQRQLKQEKEAQAAKLESNPDDDQEEMKVDASVEGSTDKPEDGSAEKPAENPDEDGMKKMRQDFFANMSNLDEEFEAGRSKLAKLRERIRRAKGVVQEVDVALQSSS